QGASIREERRRVRFDVIDWMHAVIAAAGKRLSVLLSAFRRRNKSLDGLDREIQDARLLDVADSSEGPLDVDALASTEERRLIIGLHLDGWSWHEINKWLHNR